MNSIVARVTSGDITLQQASTEIRAGLERLRVELQDRKIDIGRQIEQKTEDLKRASEQGDRSENAEFTEAIEKLQQLRAALRDIETQITSMAKDADRKYVPIGIIVDYTTFRIRDNEGVEYVYMMFPENISDLEKNIMAKNARIAQALWRKCIGDVVEVPHDTFSSEVYTYTVVDIY